MSFTVLAWIVLVLLGLFVFLRSVRQRKLAVNKFIIILAVVCIAYLVISGSFGGGSGGVDLAKWQKQAPPYELAPRLMQTSSRAYYIATYTEDQDWLTLTAYYYYDGRKWIFSDTPLPFDKQLPENRRLKVEKRRG